MKNIKFGLFRSNQTVNEHGNRFPPRTRKNIFTLKMKEMNGYHEGSKAHSPDPWNLQRYWTDGTIKYCSSLSST